MTTQRPLSFERIPNTSFPKKLMRDLKLISIDPKNTTIMGSSTYRNMLYPSDYDMLEQITGDTMEDTILFFAHLIQKLVSNLVKQKNHFFMELKAGLDHRYDIDIGTVHNNQFIINSQLREIVDNYHKNHLFNDDEYSTFQNVFNKSNPNQLDYETLKQLVRKHKIIRWTPHEVKLGYKLLEQYDDKYYLISALKDHSYVNIEVLSFLNGKLTDESNFFCLGYMGKDKELHMINVSQEIVSNFDHYFTQILLGSIETFAYSKLEYNPMKVIKRIFAYSRFTNNIELFKKIEPMINSQFALMYQIKGEITTLIKLMEKFSKVPIKLIKSHIQQIKYKLIHVSEFTSYELKKINKIIDTLDKVKYNPIELIQELDHIKHEITSYVNLNVEHYLKQVGLLPIPSYLLPEKRIF